MKKVGINIIIVVTLLFVLTVIAQDTQLSQEEIDLIKLYTGENVKDLGDQPSIIQEQLLNTPEKVDFFLNELEASGNKDKFYDLWLEDKVTITKDAEGNDVTEKNPKFGDKAKKKIWDVISKDKKRSNDFTKQILKRKYSKKFGSLKFNNKINHDPNKFNIDLTNPEDLSWQGNDLVLIKDSKKVAWTATFPDMQGIKYKDGVFTYPVGLEDGGTWDLSSDSGSFDEFMRRIRPNERLLGIHTEEGLVSIKYSKKSGSKLFDELELRHYVEGQTKSDGTPKINTVKLERKKIGDDIFNQFVEIYEKKVSKEVSDIITDTATDFTIDFEKGTTLNKLGINVDNTLSFAIKNPKGSSIFVTEDNSGTTIVKPANGASFATINKDLDITKNYGIAFNDFESEFTFDSVGNLFTAKNYRVEKNGFTALVSEDPEKVVRFQISKHKLTLDNLLIGTPNIVGRLGKPTDQGGLNGLNDIVDVIEKELASPDLALEYKAQLQNLKEEYSKLISESSSDIINSILPETGTQNNAQQREYFTDLLRDNIEGGLADLYTNSETLPILLDIETSEGREKANKLVGDLVSNRLDNKEISEILDVINRNFGEGLGTIDLKSTIKTAVEGLDYYGIAFASGENADKTRANLITKAMFPKLGEGTTEFDERSNSIVKLMSNLGSEVRNSESINLVGTIKQKAFEILESDNYQGPLIILDENSRTISIRDAGVSINLDPSAGPLRRLEVDNKETQNVNLFTGGEYIASIKDKEIHANRAIRNLPSSNMVSINEIYSDKDSSPFKLGNPNGYYELYDPLSTVRTDLQKSGSAYQVVNGLERKLGKLGTTITKLDLLGVFRGVTQMPVYIEFDAASIHIENPRDSYIGNDPDAKLTISTDVRITGVNNGHQQEKIKGFWEEFYKSEEGRLGAPMSMISQNIDSKLNTLLGSKQIDPDSIKRASELFTFAEDNGVRIPRESWDQLYIAQNRKEIEAISTFLENAYIPQGQTIEFTNNYIRFTGALNTNTGIQTGTWTIGNYKGKNFNYNGVTINPANFRFLLDNLNKNRRELTAPIRK